MNTKMYKPIRLPSCSHN